MALDYDLILKGGEVVDPAQSLRGKRDVAFKGGKVAAVAESVSSEQGAEVLDVSGKLVVPGLIDLHGHFAIDIAPFGADPDETNLSVGVTTAVDAGSTGWTNFPGFRRYVIDRSETRIYAFLHLSAIGSNITGALGMADLEEFRFATTEEAIKCVEANSDVLLGVKVRLSPDGTTAKHADAALKAAREIADHTNKKVMVHVMDSLMPMGELFQHLKPGDIATHIFQGTKYNVLNDKGYIHDDVWTAYKKGYQLDTACFAKHYSLPICKVAIEEKLLPNTISTDITGVWPGEQPGYDMLSLMSLFLASGMSVEQVIKSVTANAAATIGQEDIGTLRPGAEGDAAVLELEEGDFAFDDKLGNEIRTKQRFAPTLTVKGGRRWRPK